MAYHSWLWYIGGKESKLNIDCIFIHEIDLYFLYIINSELVTYARCKSNILYIDCISIICAENILYIVFQLIIYGRYNFLINYNSNGIKSNLG